MVNNKDTAFPFEMKDSRMEIAQSASSMEESTGFRDSSTKWSTYRVCVTLIDVINHVLIVALTIFLLYYSLKSYSITNVHVALCTIGYILLMSEAILILAGENILTNFLTRRARGHIHWILQILGLICTLVGVIIMYRAKKVHFTTIHGLTGIVSLAIMCFLAIGGYPVFVAVKLRKIIRPVVIKFIHNFLGILCFVVGIVSQCYGYEKSWLSYVTNSMHRIELICVILTALITVFSLRSALRSLCAQTVALFN